MVGSKIYIKTSFAFINLTIETLLNLVSLNSEQANAVFHLRKIWHTFIV
jgi:hypothetical protein